MKLLSTFESQDLAKTAWVFKTDGKYLVEVLDSITRKEYKHYFSSENEAECFAEDWVL
jgi:hypothetical protein